MSSGTPLIDFILQVTKNEIVDPNAVSSKRRCRNVSFKLDIVWGMSLRVKCRYIKASIIGEYK